MRINFSVLRHNSWRLGVVLTVAACSWVLIRQVVTPEPGIPRFADFVASYESSDSVLLDRVGAVLQEIRTDLSRRRIRWTRLEEIPEHLQEAVIRAEDRRFYRHAGVDWIALGAAAGQTLTGKQRGASTISMQLANFLAEPNSRPGRRTLAEKARQIWMARMLEGQWTKHEILEAYLNLVSFRGEIQGVGTASAGLFGKAPHGLTQSEGLVLAALIRSPNAEPRIVEERALRLGRSLGLTDLEPGIARACARLGHAYRIDSLEQGAPHAARLLLSRELDGLNSPGSVILRTTIDAEIQGQANQLLRAQLLRLGSQNVMDGAILVVDNRSGEVLAYVGSGGDLSSARFVDGVQAFRQAGSTLKPFLYALAFESRLLTAASLLEDRPYEVPVSGGLYRPANYDRRFRGLVTARQALASSLNVPAVRTLQLVGLGPFVETLNQLGLSALREADYYGPSIALGSADVRLWDMVNAYRALANGGLWSPLTLRSSEVSEPSLSSRVFSEEAAFIVSNILSDRESRSLTFGLESALATAFWSAVKTGTSKDMRDNWCLGYSSHFTVGVWIGNFSGAPMWNVTGISGAAPVWVGLMDFLHQGLASSMPAPPRGVVLSRVRTESWFAEEWFIAGTEIENLIPREAQTVLRISYPADGSVLALDPEIPADLQKVFFKTSGGIKAAARWWLDGEEIASSRNAVSWTPRGGVHTLRLGDAQGNTLDEVSFSVRGFVPVPGTPDPQSGDWVEAPDPDGRSRQR